MKKVMLSALAAVALSAAPAFAADMPVKAAKVVAAPAPSIFDIAIGGVVMTDYNFRGVSQSNRGWSGGAYFEPQLSIGFGTLYAGVAAYGISWPTNLGFTDPSAEVDLYGGWRNTFGAFSVDLGLIYYYYPQETFNGFTSNSDFYEIYGKFGYAITPALSIGANVFYTPDLLNYSETFATAGVGGGNVGATYASFVAKWTTPWTYNGIGSFISGELGHWWIDGSQFVAAGAGPVGAPLGGGIDPDYTYYNIGIGFTYKALTLDLRYHGTDQSADDCASFLATNSPNASNRWCNDTFIASLKFDTTLSALK